MSASREKKTRQEQVSSGWTDPKTAQEAKERKEARRTNLLYGTIGVVFLVVAVIAASSGDPISSPRRPLPPPSTARSTPPLR